MSAIPWIGAVVRQTTARIFDRRVLKDPLVRALVETAFVHENRLRALEGKAPITKAQAIAVLKQRYLGQ